MQAHRTEAVVNDDSSLTLRDLPFPGGEAVEIIVLRLSERRSSIDPNAWRKLEGLPIKYIDPFEPAVPLQDWDALR